MSSFKNGKNIKYIIHYLIYVFFLHSFLSLFLSQGTLQKKKPTRKVNVPMRFGLFYACVSFWKELPVVTFLFLFLENNDVIIFDLIFINFLLVWRRWTPIFSRLLCVKEGSLFPVTEIGVSACRLYFFFFCKRSRPVGSFMMTLILRLIAIFFFYLFTPISRGLSKRPSGPSKLLYF